MDQTLLGLKILLAIYFLFCRTQLDSEDNANRYDSSNDII